MRRLALLLLATVVPSHSACAQRPTVATARRSNIVFTGTVTRVGAASFAAVSPTSRTLVVRVEDVLDKPAELRLVAGDSVTVEPLDSTLKSGARATFYTTGWVFGHGVAVREVAHEMLPAQTSLAARRDSFLQLKRQVTDSTLAERVRAADMIVAGRVEAIRAASLAPQPRRRITEHDPEWQEAVIAVDSMIKGPGVAKVVVRFPGSLDIAWRRLPKFTAGQTGTFLLHRDTLSGTPHATMAGQQVTAYLVPQASDVLSAADAARVRALAKP
ncbi:MAG TPA: hypothetical protein VFP39_09110 [Gemmatimonadales bacterium]|nr:hypothetical protein [Gemmatimonadales bacterium]